MYFQHDSLDITYRRPQGAVKVNEEVEISARVADIHGEVFLLLRDRVGERLLAMWPVSAERFLVRFRAMEEPGLMFYGFLIRQDGRDFYYCGSTGRGEIREDRGELWQITVYAADYETPAWFRQAIAYQIFPDRFCRSEHAPMTAGAAYHQRMGRKVYIHQNWAEEPYYRPHGGSRTYAPDDYYGGDINGIREKLPYLEELGITCIYLNPIFEADSNHRYNTADYKRVDPLLGTEEDFKALCAEAKERGIRIVLDGVFSHTGADSRYFDKRNRYGNGAYHHTDSPYFAWYRFSRWPERYECWWGFDTLPNVEEKEPSYGEFIHGPDGVLHKWLQAGASGWRLDVADELPDEVLALIRRAAKEEKPDAPIIGEVWEDAVIKESYGGRRDYALGNSLDSVMNYPFRTAVLDFLHFRIDARALRDFLRAQRMNYPEPMYYCLMNLLGSHDVERLLSALATDIVIKSLPREEQLKIPFTAEKLSRAVRLEKLGAALQFALPGVPSIYYGDEQGMEGVGDPFNRAPFREGSEELHKYYVNLSALRNSDPVFAEGKAFFGASSGNVLTVLRYDAKKTDGSVFLTVVNRGEEERFCADLGCVGLGVYRGTIGKESAETIRIR